MQQYLKKALFASIILFISVSASGQYTKRKKFLEGLKVQPKVGVNMFYGDLVSEARTNYTFGVASEKELTRYINIRLDINYGSMKGTQLSYSGDQAYATFDNTYLHFNGGITFRPLDLALGLFKQRRINPYIIGQVGLMSFSATEYFGADSGFEPGSFWRDASGMAPTVSIGGGLNIYYSSQLSFTAEFIPSYAFSDQLDAHDEWYTFDNSGNIESVHKTAGNDFFYVATVGMTYLFDDSQWKNSPKYNRKAYLRTRSLYKNKSSGKYKRPKRRKTKRYKR